MCGHVTFDEWPPVALSVTEKFWSLHFYPAIMPPKKKGRAGKSREKPQITPDATPTKQMKSSRRWVVPREEETDRDCEEVFENGDLTTAPKTLFTKKAKQLASR